LRTIIVFSFEIFPNFAIRNQNDILNNLQNLPINLWVKRLVGAALKKA
jgi:hypothetical protein